MSKAKVVANLNIEEPSFQPVEVFERADEKFRREYAEAGADWAYFIVMFLRGRRRLDIQPAEVVQTHLFLRSSDAERRALLLVCETDNEIHPSPEDARRLREKDNWLDEYLSGRNLGHADWVNQIQNIPARVRERENYDRNLFPRVYKQPRLFSFLFEGKR